MGRFRSPSRLMIGLMLLIVVFGASTCVSQPIPNIRDNDSRQQVRTIKTFDPSVEVYAPGHFAAAKEQLRRIQSRLAAGENAATLAPLIDTLNKQLSEAEIAAARTRTEVQPLLEVKSFLERCGCRSVASAAMDSADNKLNQAIAACEKGDVRAGRILIRSAMGIYRDASIESLTKSTFPRADSLLNAQQNTATPAELTRKKREMQLLKLSLDSLDRSASHVIEAHQSIVDRISDILGRKPQEIDWYIPETLVINGFTVVVDTITVRGQVESEGKVIRHVSGSGWTSFTCCSALWSDALNPSVTSHFLDTSFFVVDRVRDSAREISVSEAALIRGDAVAGDTIRLEMPLPDSTQFDFARVREDYFRHARLRGKGCVPVGFRDVDIELVTKDSVGRITSGSIVYNAAGDYRKTAIELQVAGFTVLVKTLRVTPTTARANALLQFPSCLPSGSQCAPAEVNLGIIDISPQCEFFVERPDETFGPLWLGNTGIVVHGKGFVADFSKVRRCAGVDPALSPKWRGVCLMDGSTLSAGGDVVVSNSGYLRAPYTFESALIDTRGFSGKLTVQQPYAFETLIPLRYKVAFDGGELALKNNEVQEGELTGCTIGLPLPAVVSNDQQVVVTADVLQVQPDRDLLGRIDLVGPLEWGELTHSQGRTRAFSADTPDGGEFYLSSQYRDPYYSVLTTAAQIPELLSDTAYEAYGIQGATLRGLRNLVVYTPDTPNEKPIRFRCRSLTPEFINIGSQGVFGQLTMAAVQRTSTAVDSDTLNLGPIHATTYKGGTPFEIVLYPPVKQVTHYMRFISSAVSDCQISGRVILGGPANTALRFKKMQFTSTAHNAGGQVDLSQPAELEYWGLTLVGQPGFSSAGLVCVKTGEILLTAAGLTEPRHFSRPFYLKWGELLASGNMGRLIFDYNTAGQAFDGFNFSTQAVRLSPWDVSTAGYLQVGGDVHFDFFGPNYFNIQDFKDANTAAPFDGRRIELSPDGDNEFKPTHPDVHGQWSGTLGFLSLDVKYDASDQDGFVGKGTGLLQYFATSLSLSAVFDRERICFNLQSAVDQGISLGPVASFALATHISGCGCIEQGRLAQIGIRGELSTSTSAVIFIRGSAYGSLEYVITPSYAEITVEGDVFISLLPMGDVEVYGKARLRAQRDGPAIEGDISGRFNVAVVLSGLEAEGQVNWHLGADYHLVQGRLAINIMGLGASGGVEGGFFIGRNAPKAKAWILRGADPRCRLDTNALPQRLTGVYGYMRTSCGFNVYILSGGIDVYAGFGMFVLEPALADGLGAIPSPVVVVGTPYVIGQLGVRVHGEILGGLVSASAWGCFSLIAPYPGQFEGRVGLEGCVAWVVCASTDITVGMNTADGFYIR